MNKRIKLTKKVLKNECIRVSPSWISNGRWVFNKSIVEPDPALANAATLRTELKLKPDDTIIVDIGDDGFEKILYVQKATKAKITRVMFKGAGKASALRVYRTDAGLVTFDNQYTDLAEGFADTLYGNFNNYGAYADTEGFEDIKFALAPYRQITPLVDELIELARIEEAQDLL